MLVQDLERLRYHADTVDHDTQDHWVVQVRLVADAQQ